MSNNKKNVASIFLKKYNLTIIILFAVGFYLLFIPSLVWGVNSNSSNNSMSKNRHVV